MSNQSMHDQSAPNQYEPTGRQVAPQKESKGCLYGCLLVLGVVVALLLCGGFGIYYAWTSQVAKYTSETPIELPVVEYSAEDLATLQTRIESFSDAMDSGAGDTDELVLSADDLNALISSNEDFKGRVYVYIEDGEISADVSVPTTMIPGAKDRFFNGSASVDAFMQNDILVVTLKDAEVNGEPLPPQFVDGMRGENLAKDMYKDPDNAKVLKRFEDIRIEDDKIIVKLKPAEKTPAEDMGAEDMGAEDMGAEDMDPEELDREIDLEPAGV